MKKIPLIFILFSAFYLLSSISVLAQENNKVGISLLQPTSEDFVSAAALINGNSGDWGYVTLVIQENDRDIRKWQDIFETLREKHLIPIIRLATSPEGEVWRRPEEKDAKDWLVFFNKLNWVIKKRYIVLFNEPNHAVEWGGEVDPENYGKVAIAFAKQFKESNKDYIVMLAGLDGAAPSYPPQYEDSEVFIRKMFPTLRSVFNEYIDAWASHSYPNPGFAGGVWDTGKKSIRGYEYELNVLKELGATKNLPVFITETGWKKGALSEIAISENYYTAYTQIWGKDSRVQAVTPFVFKYLAEPFIGFSWEKADGYTDQYNVVKDLPKQKGAPEQIQKGSLEASLPSTLIARSTYHFSISVKNEGQAIWSADNGYALFVQSDSNEVKTLVGDVHMIRPFEDDRVSFTLKTPQEPQTIHIILQLKQNGKVIAQTERASITIEPFPELIIKTSLFPKFISNGEGFEVQLFNTDEELVFSKKGITMKSGALTVGSISGIIPGQWYRVVVLGYPYLPRQEVRVINKGKNVITLKRLLPFDADGNGRLDLNDLKVALTNPIFLLRFIPWREN
jgi:hypothetical protein